jgi:hypothetical protein
MFYIFYPFLNGMDSDRYGQGSGLVVEIPHDNYPSELLNGD